MKCPKCGKEIANESQFCEFCGTQTRKGNKHVDIRWSLLPAMLITTVSMLGLEGLDFTSYSKLPASVLMILSAILFFVSLWYGIRRRLPASFVVIMGILLTYNGIMCLYIFVPNVTVRYGLIFMPIVCILLPLYIAYAFLAHKKGWTF